VKIEGHRLICRDATRLPSRRPPDRITEVETISCAREADRLREWLSYEAALSSFRTNFEIMAELGLKPVAYAYPYGLARSQQRVGRSRIRGFSADGFSSGIYPIHTLCPATSSPHPIGSDFLHWP
jgi:hypothetical protein